MDKETIDNLVFLFDADGIYSQLSEINDFEGMEYIEETYFNNNQNQ
jgi:hypothetical protein